MPEELLEIRNAAGAFERIEEWLAGRGFFSSASEDLVADVYLGYGLSQSIRRSSSSAPPEPCSALPLAACRVGSTQRSDRSRAGFTIGAWERSWTAAEYRSAIDEVRDAIARGDVYQVNLVQHLQAPFAGDPHALAARLLLLRPLHRDAFVTEGWAVVSASPELFLARRGDRIRTMPIKGTRPLGGAAELRTSEKDAAEHVMIVDLERNDLSRVCEPATVRWPELMATHELAGVEHMVSTVEGTLRPGVGLAEILSATFPGGSVTGRTEDRGSGSHRGARAGRAWRLHGRDRAGLRERGLRPGAHHPHVRRRRRDDPPLGRRWHRLGLRLGRRGGGVVDEGPASAHGDRIPRSGGDTRLTVLALAVTGRGLVDPSEPVIRADDEGLLRGRAAFETLRVYGGRPFGLEAHLDRLTASAASIGLPAVERRRLQVLVGLVLPKASGGDASLRLVWTAGPAGGIPSALALLSEIPDTSRRCPTRRRCARSS